MFFGPLSDMGQRKLLIALGVALTMAAGLFAYVSDPLILTVLLLSTYVGSAAFHPAGASLAFSVSRRRRGLMMGIFAAGGAIGLASSQIVYAYLYRILDGQTFVLALPVLAIAGWILYQRLPEETTITRKRPSIRDIAGLMKVRELRLLYFALLANQAFYWGLVFLLPDILLQRGYETWVYSGGGHFVMVSGLALLTVPLGLLADRIGPRRVLLTAELGALSSVFFILLQPQLSVPVLLMALFLLGACAGSCSPVGVVLGNQLYPGRPGSVTGFLMGFVWLVSEGLGQGLAGGMTALFESGAAAKSMAILGVLMLFSFGLTLMVPNPVVQEES